MLHAEVVRVAVLVGVVLVLASACSDDPADAGARDATSTSEAAWVDSRCASPDALQVDLDRDQKEDRVFHVLSASGDAELGACIAGGGSDVIEGCCMVEVLSASDINHDGRAEIFYGGTTASAMGAKLAVWHRDHLQPVVFTDGEPLAVEAGVIEVEGDEIERMAAWGCEDTNEDGMTELVGVVVVFEGSEATWTKHVLLVDGALARRGGETSGTLAVDEATDRATLAAELTSACPPAVTF